MNRFGSIFGMMIVATVVKMTLTLTQGHRGMRRPKLLHQLSPLKFSISMDGIWCIVEIFWHDEPHTQFVLPDQCAREKTLLMWFCHRNKPLKH